MKMDISPLTGVWLRSIFGGLTDWRDWLDCGSAYAATTQQQRKPTERWRRWIYKLRRCWSLLLRCFICCCWMMVKAAGRDHLGSLGLNYSEYIPNSQLHFSPVSTVPLELLSLEEAVLIWLVTKMTYPLQSSLAHLRLCCSCPSQRRQRRKRSEDKHQLRWHFRIIQSVLNSCTATVYFRRQT